MSASVRSPGHRETGLAVTSFALVALSCLYIARELRSGLWLGPEGVRIRNRFKTYEVPTSEAVAFVAQVVGKGAPCPWLKRTHGRPVPVSALRVGGWWLPNSPAHVRRLEPVVGQLNALLDALRPARPAVTDQAVVARDAGRDTAGGLSL